MDMKEWTQAFLKKLHCTGAYSLTFFLCLLRDSSILHCSWKIIRAPVKIYLFFPGFPLYYLQRFYALCCFPVAADILWPFRTQTKTCDNVTHIHLICSDFRWSFPALNISATRRWVFSSPLMLRQYPPLHQNHIISFHQFSQLVINEPDKKLPDHKWPGYLPWDFSAAPFCFNEHCLSSLTWSDALSLSLC